jgi:uncharacterized protein YyaL (SSP411 family)
MGLARPRDPGPPLSYLPGDSQPPRHTNRLINEKSPYLLQHAHNPVDWHPWGQEAFDESRKRNKPIFLSIGYSTCHCYYVRTRHKEALDMVVATLRAMAKGGIHDQLGGGFHRYSLDANWFVPHFEKMLYDQAQIAVSYLEARRNSSASSSA